jgi:predicted transcriptional regulator
VNMLSEREEILKEIVDRVGDEISRETVTQKTEQFMKYGNIFLFFEVMNLRKELQILKSKTQSPLAIQRDTR